MSIPQRGTKVLGSGAIISLICTWDNAQNRVGEEEAGQVGGGGKGKKEIKRPINICQTLKCKSLACVPVETKSSIITFLGRA